MPDVINDARRQRGREELSQLLQLTSGALGTAVIAVGVSQAKAVGRLRAGGPFAMARFLACTTRWMRQTLLLLD